MKKKFLQFRISLLVCAFGLFIFNFNSIYAVNSHEDTKTLNKEYLGFANNPNLQLLCSNDSRVTKVIFASRTYEYFYNETNLLSEIYGNDIGNDRLTKSVFVYDSLWQLLARYNYSKSISSGTNWGDDLHYFYSYDTKGNVIYKGLGTDDWDSLKYNDQNQLVMLIHYNAFITADSTHAFQRHTFSYDSNGRLILDYREDNWGVWVSINKHSYEYDEFYNVTRKIWTEERDHQTHTWATRGDSTYFYTYDANRNVLSKIVKSFGQNFRKETFEYDDNNNVTLIRYAGWYGDWVYGYSIEYNYEGENLISRTKNVYEGGNITNSERFLYEYDSLNNLTNISKQKLVNQSWIPFPESFFSFILSNGEEIPFQGENQVSIEYSPISGIEEHNNVEPISNFSIAQNYPNPFNPNTTIEYSIPESGMVELKVFDVLGREVKTLLNGFVEVGNHSVNFNASNLSSGVYFYSIKYAGKNTITKKMLLTK